MSEHPPVNDIQLRRLKESYTGVPIDKARLRRHIEDPNNSHAAKMRKYHENKQPELAVTEFLRQMRQHEAAFMLGDSFAKETFSRK